MATSKLHRCVLLLVLTAFLACVKAHASNLNLPPETSEALQLIYSGKPDESIRLARKLQEARPDHPLGYLLEADALWWKLYCMASERKYNTIDAWPQVRPPDPAHDAYFAITDKVITLAEQKISKFDTAEMELYAGIGYALRARLRGLRYERLATAHAGVEARRHLLRCLELDPSMADAYFGLGIYNYYVDTLSGMARALRFFMGIPGGDKQEGLRQLEMAASKGELTRAAARFIMAKSLRNYDRDYTSALQITQPLLNQYPQNPLFALMAGDLEAKLGLRAAAAAHYRAAMVLPNDDPECTRRVQQLAREALAVIVMDGLVPAP